jgi:hypothetical protein
MAFIDKKDPVVLNIKLTSKGRELLSEGNLNFKYYSIGDSEMDYVFNAQVKSFDVNYSPFYSHILRPVDKNPTLLSYITRNLSGDTYNPISNVPSTPTIIQNTAPPIGFFTVTSGATTFITDSDHVKQPDAMVVISGISGGNILNLKKAPTYLANVNEPQIGDLLLIKWTNPFGISTTGYTVNKNYPTPYLIYKIQDISGGTLAANNLTIQVDRDLPDFSLLTGGSNNIVAGAMIYYNYINYSGSSIFNDNSTDYVNEAVIAFLENCQCPTITFPFWNMTIIYTDSIAGVQPTDRNFAQYNSRTYGGFVSYIQNQSPIIKKLGVIHYTNSSPSNTYGEELYQNTPTLDLPTIMWHKSLTKTLGTKFKAYGNVKTLTGETVVDTQLGESDVTSALNTNYYDLADLQGNVVGKVFVDLKLFVIEDQELLFAMSYKSNRSWTLPNYSVGINDNVTFGCQLNMITFILSGISPTIIGGNNGKLIISDILGYSDINNMLLEVKSGSTVIFYGKITGETTINNLSAEITTGTTFTANIYDLATMNIPVASEPALLKNPTSSLKIYSITGTSSGLNPNFVITQNSNPTNIIIYKSDIGLTYGTASALIKPYGVLPSISDVWESFVGLSVPFNGLTFTSAYTIYIKDIINPTTEFIVSKNYVAAGNPLNASFLTSQDSDTGGTYINVSSYLAAINTNVNPVVGVIELSLYHSSSVPTEWIIGTGIPVKLYVSDNPINNTANYYSIAVRERQNNIVMYSVTKQITITS